MTFKLKAKLGTETEHPAMIAPDPFTAHLTAKLRSFRESMSVHSSAEPRTGLEHPDTPSAAGEAKSRRKAGKASSKDNTRP